MGAPEKYRSQFTNQYGEEWKFVYDPATGEGILRGSDVDWQEYRVVEGLVPDLILNEEEVQWLRNAWKSAAGRH